MTRILAIIIAMIGILVSIAIVTYAVQMPVGLW